MAGMLLTAASCSDNVVDAPDNPTDKGQIRFAAESAQYSRSVTTTETLDAFTVYAFTEGQPFMENVKVTKSGNSWSYSPAQYWPTTPVNFYAYSPTTWPGAEQGADPTQPIEYYNQYGYTDILYGVAMGQTQGGGPVVFNFRHALSQVSVNLRTDMADKLAIRVYGVSVENIKTKGVFTFPRETTAPGSDVRGTWTEQSGANTYMYFNAQALEDCLALTSEAQPANVITPGLLVPQTLTPLSFDNNMPQGSFIRVDLEIYDTSTGKEVWPNSETPDIQLAPSYGNGVGTLYFSLATESVPEWVGGTHYIYTITVNEPNSLQQIEFGQPSVDTYTQVTVAAESVNP